MTDIYTLPLTAGLSFIGYEGFSNFLPIFQNLHFFGFHRKESPLKVDDSQKKNYESWRKQMMSMNQECSTCRLYYVKVSKF